MLSSTVTGTRALAFDPLGAQLVLAAGQRFREAAVEERRGPTRGTSRGDRCDVHECLHRHQVLEADCPSSSKASLSL